jgi:hypothetical protein
MSGLEHPEEGEVTCNICSCEFDIDSEGGIVGYLGILPVAMCPMCFSGLDMFFTELHGCGEHEDNED